MGRKKVNIEQTPARFREGTLAAIERLRDPQETRADFIRDAVYREIGRRLKSRIEINMLTPPVGTVSDPA